MENVLLCAPSAADATAVGTPLVAGEEEEQVAAIGAPRVELPYEPRYQRCLIVPYLIGSSTSTL